MSKARILPVLVCGLALFAAVHAAEDTRDLARKVSRVVGRVGLVWPVDARYAELQKELADKYSDVPSWDQYKAEERWIIATAREPVVLSGAFKSRSKTAMNLQVGDIVELSVSDRKSVKSYQELTAVTKLLCKSGTPEYDECAKNNPVAWFDKDGKPL